MSLHRGEARKTHRSQPSSPQAGWQHTHPPPQTDTRNALYRIASSRIIIKFNATKRTKAEARQAKHGCRACRTSTSAARGRLCPRACAHHFALGAEGEADVGRLPTRAPARTHTRTHAHARKHARTERGSRSGAIRAGGQRLLP